MGSVRLLNHIKGPSGLILIIEIWRYDLSFPFCHAQSGIWQNNTEMRCMFYSRDMASSKRPNVFFKLGQRCRRWSNFKTTLDLSLLFARSYHIILTVPFKKSIMLWIILKNKEMCTVAWIFETLFIVFIFYFIMWYNHILQRKAKEK